MALKFASILTFAGIDTTASAGYVSVNRSPVGPNAHEAGQVLGQVLDITTNNDHTLDFVLVQGWQDSTEKVVTYGVLQASGINNSGKQFLAVFMTP